MNQPQEKNVVSSAKRSKITMNQHQTMIFTQEINQTGLKLQNITIEKKICENLSSKRQNWRRSQEQQLFLTIMKEIIEYPYLNFSWTFYQEAKNLRKISQKISKHVLSCQLKFDELSILHTTVHDEQNFVQFILNEWQRRRFTNKIGVKLIKEIKMLMTTKSLHMELLDQQLNDFPQKQKAIDDIYSQIMNL